MLDELKQRLNIASTGARAVVIGFGNVGARIAALLHEAGYMIVGLADSGGGIRCADGLDPHRVAQAKRAEGSVAVYRGNGDVRRMAAASAAAMARSLGAD